MSRAPHMTPDEFRTLGHRMVDWIAGYMERVESLPVMSRVKPGEVAAGLPLAAPEHGEGWDAVFGDIERVIMPGLTHWQSPNFFGYFPCNASGPGILGELLSAGLNVNGMLWATSPAATELETRMLDWMARAMGLPEKFLSTSEHGGGCIQGTASESAVAAMAAAAHGVRDWMNMLSDAGGLKVRHPFERTAADGCLARMTVYASDQAHSSIAKGARVLGLHLRVIGVDEGLAMRPDQLEQAIVADLAAGLAPIFVAATIGTTSTTAVDPLGPIADVLDRTGIRAYGAWLHVDAAHAGPAMICEEFRWMFAGLERADSLCVNPHKWMLTNFDCDLFWTSRRAWLIDAMSIQPEYLRNAASDARAVIDYRDWHLPLGRRFRALKLWFVLRHYGLEGIRAYLREHVRLAALFESWVRADDRFEIVAPRTLSLVCFRLRGEGQQADERNKRLLDALNASGRVLLSHTTLPEPDAVAAVWGIAPSRTRVTLRMAIGAAGTQERHVAAAWDLIRRTADTLA